MTDTTIDPVATLNPLTLPLRGSRLIEASAGTGKTYTIAALYVRLVLGHGDMATSALLPSQVLVMTFTKAATRELSQRIRQRLVDAAKAFRGELDEKSKDDFIRELVACYPGEDARRQAAWRLAVAADAMDDAAVFTIDAWCQRMLREHAFDSGSLFDEELQPNESALLAEAAADYWRQQVYPLDRSTATVVLDAFGDVEALVRATRALLGQVLPAPASPPAPGIVPATSLGDLLNAYLAERRAWLDGWPARVVRLREWMQAQIAASKYPFNARSLGRQHVPKWLDALDAWVKAGALEPPGPKANWTRFAADELEKYRNPEVEPVTFPPECRELQELLAKVRAAPPPAECVRAHAAGAVAARLKWLKQARRTFGFADLLERLHAALGTPGTNEGSALRERIRAQYPVALVDEFQDTSPLQLSIFEKVYGLAENRQDGALLLIGDPKQSIYAFRGADIHSYLAARRATFGRHHALPRNFRSTVPMVAAVNALFLRAEQLAAEGAFRLRGPDDDGLPFARVAANGRNERLLAGEAEIPPLTFNVEAAKAGVRASRHDYAARCAVRIASWLRGENAHFAGRDAPRPLRPADCVVLVRSGTEAMAVRRALRRWGLRSVYLSEGDSVFSTQEALDLLRLLQAVIAPRQLRLVRAALATRLIGKELPELHRLAIDEEAFDTACEQLRELRGVWQSRGILAMVRETLHRFGIPSRWLADTDGLGERRLTNLLQLGELLQAASQQAEGETALVHWLATQVGTGSAASPAGGADDPQVLRLESDAELVRIVTIHKSKGLEYPVVFLPFATHFREANRRNTSFVVRSELVDGCRARQLKLSPDQNDLRYAELERHREDLRLLYVALTRARHAVWVGAPCVTVGNSQACQWAKSGLGHLLPAGIPEDSASCIEAVREFAEYAGQFPDHPQVVVESAAEAYAPRRLTAAAVESPAAVPPKDSAPIRALPLVYCAEFDRSWALLSYSALVKGATAKAHESRLRAPREDEPDEATPAGALLGSEALPSAMQSALHDYPGGAEIGDFLHRQLEWLAADQFSLHLEDTRGAALRKELAERCRREGRGDLADSTLKLLAAVCAAPLPVAAGTVPLSGLASPVPEMEFWMPADGLSPQELERLCRTEVLPGLDRPALSGGALHGMLKGIIDLVFEHEGRYWVLDYKSNRLGRTDADYTREAIEQAMADHRYDVQAVVYLLALHRQLRVRLGKAYRPREQLGGAIYLFMRGLNGPAQGCAVLSPPWGVLEALDRALPSGEVAA